MEICCGKCLKFSLSKAGELGRLLFGVCQEDQTGRFRSVTYPRDCPAFDACLGEELKKREKFLASIKRSG